jgi:hypothetical protein
MVVGVLWGGLGRCTMTIQDDAAASSWKYGGAAEFSYSGAGGSVSVGATYDASGSSNRSGIKVSCQDPKASIGVAQASPRMPPLQHNQLLPRTKVVRD